MDKNETREIIIALKATQKERKLTIAGIMELLADIKSPLAPTTVRRVFKEGSEDNDSFNYNTTLRPLIEALAVHGKSDAEAQLLLAANDYKDRLIEELQNQKAALQKHYEERCRFFEDRIDFMRSQIDKKDERMDQKDRIVEKLLDQVLVCSHCPVEKK